MITITKKQVSITLVVVTLAVIMVAGAIASGANSAFAHRHHHFHHFFFSHHHGKHSHTHQSIVQKCKQHQHSIVLTAGAFSPISGSGNNLAACINANLGGNAAATDQSD